MKTNLIAWGQKSANFVPAAEIKESAIFIQLSKIKILLKTLLKQFTNKILYVIIKSQINYLIIIIVLLQSFYTNTRRRL